MKNATKVKQTEFMILRHGIGLHSSEENVLKSFSGDLSRICSNSFNVMLILAHGFKRLFKHLDPHVDLPHVDLPSRRSLSRNIDDMHES